MRPVLPLSSPMSSTPLGAYHLIGSRLFQSVRCARIVLSPLCRSRRVRAPLVDVSDTVNRNRLSGEMAIMSLLVGTVVCDASAFAVGVAASPADMTLLATTL